VADSKSCFKKDDILKDTDEIFTYYIILVEMLEDFRQKIKNGYRVVKK